MINPFQQAHLFFREGEESEATKWATVSLTVSFLSARVVDFAKEGYSTIKTSELTESLASSVAPDLVIFTGVLSVFMYNA